VGLLPLLPLFLLLVLFAVVLFVFVYVCLRGWVRVWGSLSAWVSVCARVSVHGCGVSINFCRIDSICLLVHVVDNIHVIPFSVGN
jgi:hypothetical protein